MQPWTEPVKEVKERRVAMKRAQRAYKKALARAVRVMRRCNLTLRDIAAELGITHTRVNQIEKEE